MNNSYPSKFELYHVQLPTGKRVWVGTIFGSVLVSSNDDKMALLLEVLGMGTLTALGPIILLVQFLSFAKNHPVFSTVPDWTRMGISIDGVKPKLDETETKYTIVHDKKNKTIEITNKKRKIK